MTVVSQIISAVEASAKVAWSVFLSCLAALTLEHFLPELFAGLPIWVFPAIRIVAIFTFVLAIASIIPSITSGSKAILDFIYAPIWRRSITRKLLRLDINEVAILCWAIAKADRVIRIKPDLYLTISLLDKRLIRQFTSYVVFGDGTDSFEVPSEVWRILLSMEEFRLNNPRALLRIFEEQPNDPEEQLLDCLPKLHPAVIRRMQQLRGS